MPNKNTLFGFAGTKITIFKKSDFPGQQLVYFYYILEVDRTLKNLF